MTFKQNKIDAKTVAIPEVKMTERALREVFLMIDNDPTLEGTHFRLEISGKGCDGFTYACGFTAMRDDDFIIPVVNSKRDLIVLVDPFAAFYLQDCSVDFIQDFTQDAEGFVIINYNQKDFRGKFWRRKTELVPTLL